MAGLVPAIHVGPTPEIFLKTPKRRPDVDPRDKPGDDGGGHDVRSAWNRRHHSPYLADLGFIGMSPASTDTCSITRCMMRPKRKVSLAM
jgi:hypothetical protein